VTVGLLFKRMIMKTKSLWWVLGVIVITGTGVFFYFQREKNKKAELLNPEPELKSTPEAEALSENTSTPESPKQVNSRASVVPSQTSTLQVPSTPVNEWPVITPKIDNTNPTSPKIFLGGVPVTPAIQAQIDADLAKSRVSTSTTKLLNPLLHVHRQSLR
jgi:hypothetical protein